MSIFSALGSALGTFFGGPLGPVIGAAAGGLADSYSSRAAADQANDFSANMSGTAYQRGMADMRAAGLNPILAAKIGGASTPTGAVAQVGTQWGNAVNSAWQGMKTHQEVGQIEANTAKLEAEAEKIAADTNLTMQQTENLKAQLPKIVAEIEKIKADAGMTTALSAIPEAVADLVRSVRGYFGLSAQEDLEKLYDRVTETVKNAVKGTTNSGLDERLAPRMRQRRK